MKKALITLVALAFCSMATAQLKPRPDAFPPVEEKNGSKEVSMATTPAEMANWDRYPTYGTYIEMMQQWANTYPTLCRLDTIGTSIRGRLILSMELTANPTDTTLPEFFYSSTIHGDEVTGYVMMLRLIDTLLRGYGNNPQYTSLMNNTLICINPLANPDGTYRSGNNSLNRASRSNADGYDLNRNYPNPFGTSKEPLQPENRAMIAYFDRHNFKLSANLHGGAEVMNYPWDSFTSTQSPHPDRAWWQAVCQRFVDTSRTYNASHFIDTYSCGYTAGGDWYIITGGRQDYVNYYYDCHELTMEISTDKTLSGNQLPTYWNFLQHSLVNYIAEIHTLVPPRHTQHTIIALSDDTTMGYVEGSGIYTEDSTATLTAHASDGYLFTHWMDGDTTNPRLVTVTSDSIFTAYFEVDGGGDTVAIAINGKDDAVKVYVRNGCITVDNTQLPVHIYDVMGREVAPCTPRPGVYLVRVGNRPIRKLIVMK